MTDPIAIYALAVTTFFMGVVVGYAIRAAISRRHRARAGR